MSALYNDIFDLIIDTLVFPENRQDTRKVTCDDSKLSSCLKKLSGQYIIYRHPHKTELQMISKELRCRQNNRSGRTLLKCLLMLCAFLYCLPSGAQNTPLSYDYSRISPHPRLLLKAGEEAAIKAAVKKYPAFKQINDYIINSSDKLLTEPPLVYKKIGKRLLAVSREALKRLFYLSYSYRMTQNDKYLHRAEKELIAVCSFSNWNPTHFLDVGEMCTGVAIAYDWLYNALPENTKMMVCKAIVEKAFEPSYNKSYAWFLTAENNWNSVCNAGLVYGALAIMNEEKDKSIAIIERSLKSNASGLKEVAPDGIYPEGPGYWNYGTTFQVLTDAALESSLGSDNGLSQSPGFMQSAYFMLFAQGPSGLYFNYSDGGQSVEGSPALFWFADKLKDPTLIYHEIPLIKKGKYTSGKSDIDRILPIALLYGKDLNLSEIKSPTAKMFTGRGNVPVCMVRTSWNGNGQEYLGIKGGTASESHGHMDAGSFVYDVGSLRWAMDFGSQSYITLESKGVDLWNMKQHSQRWDVFRYNNLNHNTLTINNQKHNVNGKAEIVATYNNEKERGAKLDLTPALNLNDELKSATRKAVIVNNSYLKIEDLVVTNNKPVQLRWNMVTPATAKIINENTIKLSQKGHVMYLTFKADIPVKLAIRPSENPAAHKCAFGNYNYGDYNAKNPGTIMVGFDTDIPANKAVRFTTTLKKQ